MHNPHGDARKTTEIFHSGSTTHGHACGDAVGIGGTHVESAVTTKTHAVAVDAVTVDVEVGFCPLDELHDFLRIP